MSPYRNQVFRLMETASQSIEPQSNDLLAQIGQKPGFSIKCQAN